MQKTIWDLKLDEQVFTRNNGWAYFLGFLNEGLECKVEVMVETKYFDGSKVVRPINIVIPSSDLILTENAQEALQQI